MKTSCSTRDYRRSVFVFRSRTFCALRLWRGAFETRWIPSTKAWKNWLADWRGIGNFSDSVRSCNLHVNRVDGSSQVFVKLLFCLLLTLSSILCWTTISRFAEFYVKLEHKNSRIVIRWKAIVHLVWKKSISAFQCDSICSFIIITIKTIGFLSNLNTMIRFSVSKLKKKKKRENSKRTYSSLFFLQFYSTDKKYHCTIVDGFKIGMRA